MPSKLFSIKPYQKRFKINTLGKELSECTSNITQKLAQMMVGDHLCMTLFWFSQCGLNLNEDPLPKYPLTERIKIYKALFPEKQLRARCACADDYAKYYWKDKILDE